MPNYYLQQGQKLEEADGIAVYERVYPLPVGEPGASFVSGPLPPGTYAAGTYSMSCRMAMVTGNTGKANVHAHTLELISSTGSLKQTIGYYEQSGGLNYPSSVPVNFNFPAAPSIQVVSGDKLRYRIWKVEGGQDLEIRYGAETLGVKPNDTTNYSALTTPTFTSAVLTRSLNSQVDALVANKIYTEHQVTALVLASVQHLRPDAIILRNKWTGDAGETTNLQIKVNEASPANDTDFLIGNV